jgi:hypothetical protein
MREFIDIMESRGGEIYHVLDFDKAKAVFADDAMPGRWEHDIPGVGKVLGNSFTRNATLKWGRYLRLVCDQRKLAYRHRIIPLDGEYVFRNTHGYALIRDRVYNMDVHGRDPNWSEEFVVGDIKPLSAYVIRIDIREPWMTQVRPDELVNGVEGAIAYGARHGLPVNIDDNVAAKVEEIKIRWNTPDDEL